MSKRDRYTVGPSPKGAAKPWTLDRDGDVLGEWDTQEDAIDAARTVCRYRLKVLGRNAELQIKGKDGKVREADTFGDDPKASEG
ncbi:MAG TPA: DUF2188 domain-containing protein [Thermomonas sp.]|nr:DUF2188 domain-containing protein [Thermomonas sp.]